jgi:hypothetical protein
MLLRRPTQRRAPAAVAAAAAAGTARPPLLARTGRQLHLRLPHRRVLMAHSMHAAGNACVTQPLAVPFVDTHPDHVACRQQRQGDPQRHRQQRPGARARWTFQRRVSLRCRATPMRCSSAPGAPPHRCSPLGESVE